MENWWGQYSAIVAYGIGQYFERIKGELSTIVRLDYLCDRKWEKEAITEYQGIPVIKKKELEKLENALVIITSGVLYI